MATLRERAINAAETIAPLFGEFMGTFMVTATYGCNAQTGSITWMPTSIAFAVMVCMLALAHVSGGHLNPVISLGFGLVRKISWLQVFGYCLAQLCGGLAGGGVVNVLVSGSVDIGPKHNYGMLDILIVEVLFSTVVGFVALSCMASSRSNPRSDPNHYSAMAVGFVAIAGGHAGYEISGAYYNPALTVGYGLSGNAQPVLVLVYLSFQVGSAILAATLFYLTHPEEIPGVEGLISEAEGVGCGRACGAVCPCAGVRSGKQSYGATSSLDSAGAAAGMAADGQESEVLASNRSTYRASVPVRLLSEFIGSFAIVATFGLSTACNTLVQHDVQATSKTTTQSPSNLSSEVLPVTSVPWAMGAIVLSMGYALGKISGGHFNPAITIAAVFSRRSSAVTYAEFLPTITVQVGGGMLAALVYTCVNRGNGNLTRISIGPKNENSFFMAAATETFFTLVVAFVALCSTTVTSPKYFRAPHVYGYSFALTMGMAVASAGFATENISGGLLNPAITVGAATGNAIWRQTFIGDFLWNGLKYILWQSLAGVGAGLVFILAHPMEYKRDPLLPGENS